MIFFLLVDISSGSYFTIWLLSIRLDSHFDTSFKDFDILLKFIISVFSSLENICKFPLSNVQDNKSQTDIVPDRDLIKFGFLKCFIT